KVNRLGSDGRKWCWKKPGSLLKSNHVQPTVKHGGGSLMVWGCFTAYGVGNLVRIDSNMTAAIYCEILEDDLLGSLEWYGLEVGDVVFQHDNDPKHRANLTSDWLNRHGIEVLNWPPQSPDLNQIENLRQIFKMALNDYPTMPASIHELWERAEETWNA